MIDLYPLIAIVGPTGSGKSELALQLASLFGGEIVNCDSVQVYAGLDIGSAKTPISQRQNIPHHLLDVVPPQEEMTAGDYARQASAVLDEIRSRRALPVVAGGTGFYLRALLNGLSPAPTRDPELRQRLSIVAQRRPATLHRFLRMRDSAAAARIHSNDRQKLIRAIEMAGQIKSPRQGVPGFRVLKIGLTPDRTQLYDKLNRRCEWMFENGLLAETEALLASGVAPTGKALGTLGYRQAVSVLTGKMSVAAAIAECQLRTRHYAKRQITWFRAETDVCWLGGFGGEEHLQRQAENLVRQFKSN